MFRNVCKGKVKAYCNKKLMEIKSVAADCLTLSFDYQEGMEYCIEVVFQEESKLQKLKKRAVRLLTELETTYEYKQNIYQQLIKIESVEEYILFIDELHLLKRYKDVLKETVI